MLLTSAAQTDIGLVRSENEDRLFSADDLALYAVADGIGGLPGGAEAAQTAVDTFAKDARAQLAHASGGAADLDLGRAFRSANSAVIDLADQLAPDTGLGTTLCAAHFIGGRLRVASVGDSRCYLFRGGQLRLLTTDDTVENEVLARRRRGEDVQLEDRHRNALTRCIGQPMPLHVDVGEHPLAVGDRVLVCSDGITRLLPDAAIARHLGADKAPAIVLGELIAAALARGGNDNATGVLIRVDAP